MSNHADQQVSSGSDNPILTLEPLIEAVKDGLEVVGWELSGLQKTTSHQFEGRWQGKSTRSAYLFFHNEKIFEYASIDVYLDETSQGLTGNLALVVELVPLAELGDTASAIDFLCAIGSGILPGPYQRPLTLRLRRADQDESPSEAEVEVRFKLRLSNISIKSGHDAVMALTVDTVCAFQAILGHKEFRQFMPRDC